MLGAALRHIGLAKNIPAYALDALVGARDAGELGFHMVVPFLFSGPGPTLLGWQAVLGVTVGVVFEHLLDDLGLVFPIRSLGDLGQVEILDRIAVGAELETAAKRGEVGGLQRGCDGILVAEIALDGLHRA